MDKLKILKEVGEEIVTEEELAAALSEGKELSAYDGFEPSGRVHIAQGLMRAININKMTQTGVKFKMLVADWHAWANNKMGGDLEKIQDVGKYMIEVWKACGLDTNNVEFHWASELVKDDDYWQLVLQIARMSTVKRIIRCSQIMGRSESESLSAAQIFYPCMQAADIFYLGADICQLGMDQRKVNMLAREVGPQLGYYKPMIISHHMLMGLKPPAEDVADSVEKQISMKMSKSDPESAIFMTDSEEDVKRKLKKAYCPEGVILENPVLEYCRYMIFERFDEMVVERPEKFGGNLNIANYTELENLFEQKQLHPLDLKKTVAVYINKMLQSVRDYFEENETAKEIKKKAESHQVTK